MFARVVAFFAAALMPLAVFAQPLADRVPADALVYVGWQGVDSMPAAYQQSRLKAVLDSSNIPALINDMLPRLMELAAKENPREAEAFKLLSSIVGPIWRHPTAMYVCPPEWVAGGPPKMKAAIFCKAGNESEALAKQLQFIVDQAQGAPFPIGLISQGDIVGIAVGYAQPNQALAGAGGGAPITGADSFKKAMAQVHKEPVGILYVDAEGIVGQVDQLTKMIPDQRVQEMWPVIRDALGVGGLKRIVATCGFDGRDWGTQAFIAAPAPRTGLLAIADSQPLTDDAFRAIPKTATFASAERFDLAKLVNQIRATAGKIDPRIQQQIDSGLAEVQAQLGLDIQKDLFEPLGDQWSAYIDPASTGGGILGFVIVNRLNKPAEAEQGLLKLQNAIEQIAKQNAPPKITVKFDQVKGGSAAIHYISLPVVAPAWAVKDGNLFIGLYPQVVTAALENGGAGKSILDNPDFIAMRKRLGGEKATSVSFADLPRSSMGGYQLLLAGSQLGLGFGDLFGVKSPPMVIPPLSKIREQMAPAGSVIWADEEGWHMRSVEPFPGAGLIGLPISGLSAGSAGMGAAILAPALARARMQAEQVRSMSNLRQIGIGMIMYANDNKSKLPTNLGELVTGKYMPSAQVFVSPFGRKAVPGDIRAATPEEQAKWINENSDYVYVAPGVKLSQIRRPGETIIAHEKTGLNRRGSCAVFADGHAEFMPVPVLMQRLEQQKKGNE